MVGSVFVYRQEVLVELPTCCLRHLRLRPLSSGALEGRKSPQVLLITRVLAPTQAEGQPPTIRRQAYRRTRTKTINYNL